MPRSETPSVADAVRVLAAPGSVLALVVLVLNDHLLKEAWPGWVTGKLSDVAGLVLAPLLLAVVLAATGVPRSMAVATWATGIGFVFCKTSATGADVTSSVWSLFGTPTMIRADLTDLVALPALWLAWRIHRAAVGDVARGGLRRTAAVAVGMAVLPLGVLATSATSACQEPAGYEEVAVLEGEFPGAPEGVERRLVAADVAGWFSVDRDGTFAEHLHDPHADGLSRGREACVGDRCWRLSGDDAVDVTTEPHGTWVREAWLTEADRAEITEDVGTEDTCNDGPPVVGATDLAALDTAAGPIVLVSLQRGGVWQRRADGTWTVLTESEIDRLVRDTPSWDVPVYREVDVPVDSDEDGLPDETTTPQPSTPASSCQSPTPTTVTPHASNGPPTTYVVCP